MPSYCNVQTDKISHKNSSTVAHLAYITADKIKDEVQGKTFNYGKSEDRVERVKEVKTLLPPDAPEEYNDPKKLWNAIEGLAKTEDAKMAMTLMIGFPYALTKEQRVQAVVDFCNKNFTSKGVPCTVAWHDDPDDKNPHCHIIAANFLLDENGKWKETRNERKYKLDEQGNKIEVWDWEVNEKGKPIYENGEKKLKLDEDGNKIQRVVNGRKQWVREWTSKNFMDNKTFPWECRVSWCQCANQFLNKDQQISPETYEKQGIDQEPLIPYSRNAWQLEQRVQQEEKKEKKAAEREGRTPRPVRHTEIYITNQAIQARNEMSRNIAILKTIQSFFAPAIQSITEKIGFKHHKRPEKERLRRAINEIKKALGYEKADFSDVHNIYIMTTEIFDHKIDFYADGPNHTLFCKDDDGKIATKHYNGLDDMLTTGLFEGTQSKEIIIEHYEECYREWAIKDLGLSQKRSVVQDLHDKQEQISKSDQDRPDFFQKEHDRPGPSL